MYLASVPFVDGDFTLVSVRNSLVSLYLEWAGDVPGLLAPCESVGTSRWVLGESAWPGSMIQSQGRAIPNEIYFHEGPFQVWFRTFKGFGILCPRNLTTKYNQSF